MQSVSCERTSLQGVKWGNQRCVCAVRRSSRASAASPASPATRNVEARSPAPHVGLASFLATKPELPSHPNFRGEGQGSAVGASNYPFALPVELWVQGTSGS